MLTKNRLIELYRDEFAVPRGDAEKTLNWIFDTIQTELVKGEDIFIRGFGTFSTHRKPARNGRDPRNGEAIAIPARTVARFKAGRGLAATVNGG